MQLVSSRIWNRFAVSISYDYNHYTTGTNYNWYKRHFHDLQFFLIPQVQVRILLFIFSNFTLWSALVVWPRFGDPFVCQTSRGVYYYYYYYYSLRVSWRSLSEVRGTVSPPQVSRFLFSILADMNNTGVWMVSVDTSISHSICPFTWRIVPRAPITITVTFKFPSLFSSQARSKYLSLFFVHFNFNSVVVRVG